MEKLSIDGCGPYPVRKPTCVDEVREVIREAVASGTGVYPFGGKTTLGIGNPPTKPGVAVATTSLADVIDYPARDMTITVQAGIGIKALQDILALEGQRLPVDVADASQATLGGALAANLSGPRRLICGTFRDYVIGIGFMSDDGAEISAGGRVVKNVAGYDLMKLQVGALGTLGVITRVTLKVTPKPESQAVVAFGLTSAAIGPTLDRLATSNSRPAALELLNSPASQIVAKAANINLPTTDQWVIVAGFEEKTATVDWQIKMFLEELKTAPVRDVMVHRGENCEQIFTSLTDLQHEQTARLSWKAVVPPSRMARFATDAAAIDHEVLIHAHAGTGVVFGHIPGTELTAEHASTMLTNLTAQTAEGKGSLTIRRCPPEWKRSFQVWGRAVTDHGVMRAIKKSLDPKNVFNPGRLFGDL